MKTNYRLLCCGFIIILLLCGCSIEKTESPVEETALEEETVEPEIIEIKDLSDAWDTILNGSTKAFIGGHPIDEAFLASVTATYGDEAVEEIASYANFETPEIWHTCTGKSIHVLWYEYCLDTGIQNYSLENVYVVDSSSDSEIVFDFTGDISFANDVATTNYMDSQINGIYDCFSNNLVTELHSADVLMINNEFVYTNRGEALANKAYTFRTSPGRVKILSQLGVDIVGIANNHIYDYGEEGLLDSIETLENANLPYIGAGRNIDDASKPLYIITGGRKIAVVAATQIERTLSFTKEATKTEPGVLKCLYPSYFCSIIKEAKENADFCIVFVHWGTEGVSHYGNDQYSLARKFVESGADAIIGGHTHCLQTMEYMDDVPIYYSLGNFYFSLSGSMPATYNTGVAQLRIKQDGTIDAYFIPCQFENGVLNMLDQKDDAYGDIIKDLNDLSNTANLADDGRITKKQ